VVLACCGLLLSALGLSFLLGRHKLAAL